MRIEYWISVMDPSRYIVKCSVFVKLFCGAHRKLHHIGYHNIYTNLLLRIYLYTTGRATLFIQDIIFCINFVNIVILTYRGEG